MKFKRTLAALCIIAFTAQLAPSMATEPRAPYYVTFTTEDGKSKCLNRKSKEKAERCAEKMRSKHNASNVNVQAGSCPGT